VAKKAKAFGIFTTGDKQLDSLLRTFDKKELRKIGNRAARQMTKKIQSDAKLLAPVDTGELVRAIKVRAVAPPPGRKQKRRGVIGASVRVGEGFFLGDTFYAGFLEYGTEERATKSGHHTGRIVEGLYDFLRPALYSNKAWVRGQWAKAVRDAIAHFAKRAKRTMGRK